MAWRYAPAHACTLLARHTRTHTPHHGTCSTAHTHNGSHTHTGMAHVVPLTPSRWQGTPGTAHTHTHTHTSPGCTPTGYPQAHTPAHADRDGCRWTRVAHAQPCTHTLTHTCARTHTHPRGDGAVHPSPVLLPMPGRVTLCPPVLCHCLCPGSDSPGQPGCPGTAACSQHRLQQVLCPGRCPNAPQPLRSHQPRQRGDGASKASSRRWPRHHHGHWPSAGTASPIPGRGRASCERGCLAQAAWDRPACAGLEAWGLHSPVPSRQAGGTRARAEAPGAPCQLGCPLHCSPGPGTCLPREGPAESDPAVRPSVHQCHHCPGQQRDGVISKAGRSRDVACRQAGLGCQD